jgi:adenylate cyclase class 2
VNGVSIEHEAKFRLHDCLDMETRLREQGRLRTPWHFESNTVYDRSGELAASGRLLRLRRALTSTLTFKEPAPGPKTGGVKSRIERESDVSDPRAMDSILRGLGYAPRLRYEKFRSVWEFSEGLVFLDILPFGHFLEIEASPETIGIIAQKIGLEPGRAMDKSYHSLHQSWRRQQGLPPMEDFVFDEAEHQRLTICLGCIARSQGEHNAD